MSARFRLEIRRRASREIAEASAWWDLNRLKAPEAFQVELEEAIDLITTQPHIGALAVNTRLKDVRRIHLDRVHYYLYYRVSVSSRTVVVLALWHTSRGSGPGL